MVADEKQLRNQHTNGLLKTNIYEMSTYSPCVIKGT